MPTHATCRREIEALHAFFLDWYTGRLREDADGRVERARVRLRDGDARREHDCTPRHYVFPM